MRRHGALLPVVPALAIASIAALFTTCSSRSPTRLDLAHAWAAPTASRPFGSGDGGIDLLAVVGHATGRALLLATAVSLIGFFLGTPLGTVAGLARGATSRWVLRAADLVQAFPTFLLALAVLAAVRTPSRLHIGAVFCLSSWAPFARLSLVQARVLVEAQFVDAARALGATRARITLRHVLPNLLGPVAVQIGTSAAGVVLGETALAFVGLGPRDGVSLGTVLDQGTVGMLRAPHVLITGAVAVFVLSASLQLASEALRFRFGRPDELS